MVLTNDVAEHPNGLVERAKTIVRSIAVLLKEVVFQQLGNLTMKKLLMEDKNHIFNHSSLHHTNRQRNYDHNYESHINASLSYLESDLITFGQRSFSDELDDFGQILFLLKNLFAFCS